MAFLHVVLSSLLLLLMFGEGAARSIDQNDSLIEVVSGTLYALDPLSRQMHHRLHRRHLDAMNNSHVQVIRLDLGPEVPALDMELSQDSVWTDDSRVVVREGEQVEEVHNAVNSSCFLSGRLTSHNGAASLNRCGGLSGLIQTDDFHYEIQELEDANMDSETLNVTVTMTRSENGSSFDDTVAVTESNDEEEQLGEVISKRQYDGPVVAEVGVFLDANLVNYMSEVRGKRTARALTNWLIMKWNVIRGIYGNVRDAGVLFTIQLKGVEIWWTNPPWYQRLGNKARTDSYLYDFCTQTSNSPNYDHKMLYTQGTGEHHMGQAYVNKICRRDSKCSLVKSKDDAVKIELHEFGHNVGFKHDDDPMMLPCRFRFNDGGFMGWGSNYDFLDCYRRVLLRTIREPGAHCLYERNVNRPVLNP